MFQSTIWQGDRFFLFVVAVDAPCPREVQGTLDWVTGPEQYAHSMLEAEPGEEKTNPSWELLIQSAHRERSGLRES